MTFLRTLSRFTAVAFAILLSFSFFGVVHAQGDPTPPAPTLNLPTAEVQLLAAEKAIANQPFTVVVELVDIVPKGDVHWKITQEAPGVTPLTAETPDELLEIGFRPVAGTGQRVLYADFLSQGTYTLTATVTGEATDTGAPRTFDDQIVIVAEDPTMAGSNETPQPVNFQPDASGVESWAPEEEVPAGMEAPLVTQFKRGVRERILEIRLPFLDERFPDNREKIAEAIQQTLSDSSIKTKDQLHATLGPKLKAIVGEGVLPKIATDAWRDLMRAEAPEVARTVGLPLREFSHYKTYYTHLANVLRSDEVADDVFIEQTAAKLREMGYTLTPQRVSGSSSTRSYGRPSLLRWLHRH